MIDHHSREIALPLPQLGDILVTRVGATCYYAVAVVPRDPHLTRARYVEATNSARDLARNRGVAAWVSEDLVHFLPLPEVIA
ncbi:MAG TPA: hypothetical protein VMF13_21925 [Luteitalea sp.]|nr:hypothetical protein [Luteitalea sp.]